MKYMAFLSDRVHKSVISVLFKIQAVVMSYL
jgi:hypothetical protein